MNNREYNEFLKARNEGMGIVANRLYNKIPDTQNYNFIPSNNNMTQKDIFEAYVLNHQNPSILPQNLQDWRNAELGDNVLNPNIVRINRNELPIEYLKLLQNPNQNWR